MKTKFILSAVLSVGLLASASAFAKPNDSSNHGRQFVPQQYDRHQTNQNDRGRVDANQQSRNVRNDRYDSRKQVQVRDNRKYKPVVVRGYGPRGDWYQGGRIDRQYNDRRYEVVDWQRQRLSAPPRGARWVRVNNDFILASLASNIIFSIIHH